MGKSEQLEQSGNYNKLQHLTVRQPLKPGNEKTYDIKMMTSSLISRYQYIAQPYKLILKVLLLIPEYRSDQAQCKEQPI